MVLRGPKYNYFSILGITLKTCVGIHKVKYYCWSWYYNRFYLFSEYFQLYEGYLIQSERVIFQSLLKGSEIPLQKTLVSLFSEICSPCFLSILGCILYYTCSEQTSWLSRELIKLIKLIWLGIPAGCMTRKIQFLYNILPFS